MKQWAKRGEQLDRVLHGTVDMVGEIQGIAGQSLQEIEGLEMKALGDGEEKGVGVGADSKSEVAYVRF